VTSRSEHARAVGAHVAEGRGAVRAHRAEGLGVGAADLCADPPTGERERPTGGGLISLPVGLTHYLEVAGTIALVGVNVEVDVAIVMVLRVPSGLDESFWAGSSGSHNLSAWLHHSTRGWQSRSPM
jgi:hypothetical protein